VLLFESDDLGSTEDFLSAHYAPLRITSTTGESSARIARTESASITVDHLDLAFEMSYDVSPLGRICLGHVESGALADHAPARQAPETFGPGDLFSLAPPDRPYRGRIDHAHYTVAMIDPALLDQLVPAPRGEDHVRLLGHRPVSAEAGARLQAAIDHLERYVLSDPIASTSPLVVATAQRYVAAQVLAAFPTTARLDDGHDSRDAHEATVKRAVSYIEAYADTDISPADIAAAARVSTRAVQLAFRSRLDTTPTAYLRQVRLTGAHRDLVDGDVGTTTVAEVAARWGFGHLGRFGETYRQRFGETPGATLRRD
jgi:AraC-like DNA-binding protein